MENEKKTKKSTIIFITAIVCIALCIPIGIVLGRTLLGKNEGNKTNNNTQNNLTNEINNVIDNTLDIINNTINETQNVTSNVIQNKTLNCNKDNYKTCLPNVENRHDYEMIYITSDAEKLSEIQYFIADNLSYNITILTDNEISLKKSNKSYYTWDVMYMEKNIGIVNVVLNYYKNDKYIVFLSKSVASIGSPLIDDKILFIYDISNGNVLTEKVNSISIVNNNLNVIIKTINLENDIDKEKLCSNNSISNDIFGYEYFINLITKTKSDNKTILVKDFCFK